MSTNDFLETERLILRQMSTADADLILNLYNSADFLQYIGDKNIRTLEDAERCITEKFLPQYETYGYGNYAIIRKSDHQKIGSIGIFLREGLEIPDIGFAFLDGFKGMGYGFETASHLLRKVHSDFGLEQVGAITAKNNVASQNLLLKLGLTQVKTVTLPGETEELLYFEGNIK